MQFEQIAVVHLRGKEYAVMVPVDPVAGMAENQALVFSVDRRDDNKAALNIVSDYALLAQIYEAYNRQLQQQFYDNSQNGATVKM